MPLGGNRLSSSSSKKSRRRQKPSAAASETTALVNSSTRTIQSVYDISRKVFAVARPGFLPPKGSVAELSRFLNDLTLQDVGLDANMPFFRADAQGHPKVTYLHFADTPKFTVGVFCLPRSAVIPLHNHPGMTVFSKILLGSMHITSYDWVKPQAASGATATTTQEAGAQLAQLKAEHEYDASSKTMVLYPEEGGNLHRFIATTPCAVLDVMGPPYRRDQGRDCSYYNAVAAPGGDGQYAWLREVPCTFDLDAFSMRPRIRE
ncbi:hypothetical protein BRADI_2g42090v3 [Brachypodium distachyon]|uniref:cysteine dioxygenase n=1 Tax=Brachypodium distachyon TaxID=15368 RepID=A0A0Q3J7D2_BRADI|nr:hypothetical protein BRADI_2g42090v3 [Brachypodium distachyon]